jgi:hypothetical protein
MVQSGGRVVTALVLSSSRYTTTTILCGWHVSLESLGDGISLGVDALLVSLSRGSSIESIEYIEYNPNRPRHPYLTTVTLTPTTLFDSVNSSPPHSSGPIHPHYTILYITTRWVTT